MKTSLHAIFSPWLAVPVIFARQNGPRPAMPFVTLFITAANRLGHSSIGTPDGDGNATIAQDVNVTVSVQAYGPGAYDLMEGVRDRFEAPSERLALHDNGFAFIRVVSGVNDLSATVGSGYEERAQMDVELRTLRAFTDDAGLIETVELTGTVNDRTHTQTIEV